MWHALVWGTVAGVAAGWSLLAWALHRGLAALAGGADAGLGWERLEQWSIPAWLADWLPMAAVTALKTALTEWLQAWGPWLESLLAQAPGLLAWLTPLLWLAWALGLLVLAGLGLAGSVLVVALRDPAPRAGPR